MSGKKKNRGRPLKDVQKSRKSALGKNNHDVVGNKSIYVESTCARLTQASSFSEDAPFLPNLCTDIHVEENPSSSVNISEGLHEDDNEIKYLDCASQHFG